MHLLTGPHSTKFSSVAAGIRTYWPVDPWPATFFPAALGFEEALEPDEMAD
jgi:hypothetical protein